MPLLHLCISIMVVIMFCPTPDSTQQGAEGLASAVCPLISESPLSLPSPTLTTLRQSVTPTDSLYVPTVLSESGLPPGLVFSSQQSTRFS